MFPLTLSSTSRLISSGHLLTSEIPFTESPFNLARRHAPSLTPAVQPSPPRPVVPARPPPPLAHLPPPVHLRQHHPAREFLLSKHHRVAWLALNAHVDTLATRSAAAGGASSSASRSSGASNSGAASPSQSSQPTSGSATLVGSGLLAGAVALAAVVVA